MLTAVSDDEIGDLTDGRGGFVGVGAEIFVKAIEKFGEPHHQTVVAEVVCTV